MKEDIGIGLLIVLILSILHISQTLPDSDQVVSVSWNVHETSESTYTDEFYITQSAETFRLDNVKQKTNSIWDKAVVEYRLMKMENGAFVDTGIYKVLVGSIGKFEADLYGPITSGTYKIKITNLNEEDLLISSKRITSD